MCCFVRCSRPFCSVPDHASPPYPIRFDPTPVYFIPSTHSSIQPRRHSTWQLKAAGAFALSITRGAAAQARASIAQLAEHALSRRMAVGFGPPTGSFFEPLTTRPWPNAIVLRDALSPSLSIC